MATALHHQTIESEPLMAIEQGYFINLQSSDNIADA